MRKTVHSRPYKTLLAQLVEARQKAGFTQEELAKALKKPQSFIAKTERGERRLDVIEFLQIIKLLGADLTDVITPVIRAL